MCCVHGNVRVITNADARLHLLLKDIEEVDERSWCSHGAVGQSSSLQALQPQRP